ncbi:MAG TPA: DUF4157 domain-containing protein, partial [Blastocatellia bacterium]|nr:DUF4157 domain-containing protein [Blastocatellia bacterium]
MQQPVAEELSAGSATTAATCIAHNFSRIPVFADARSKIRPKLKVNAPGDQYEQEADRVAEQVMRMPESQLQRACACGGECSKCQPKQPGLQHERLQTKALGSSELEQPAAPPIVNEVLASPGHPLDLATRAFFEPRFGHDFSRVRVHSDAAARQSARDVNAHAYTVGHDIVFGAGRYAPGTHQGRLLIAHELTHVIQQRAASATVQRKVNVDDFDVEEFDPRTLDLYLAKVANGKIEDNSDSDDKARFLVRQWRNKKRELKPEIKAVLIREMQSGFTGNDDERAILTLLLHSDDYSLGLIFAAAGGIDPKDLDSDFNGNEEDELREFYDRKFEGGRKAALQGSRKLRSQEAPRETGASEKRETGASEKKEEPAVAGETADKVEAPGPKCGDTI